MRVSIASCVLLLTTILTASKGSTQEIVNGEKAKAFFSRFQNPSPNNLSVSVESAAQQPADPGLFAISPPDAAEYMFKGAGLTAEVDSRGRRYLQQISDGAKGMRDLDLWLLGGRDSQFSDAFPNALLANRISYLMRLPDRVKAANGSIVDSRVDPKQYLRAIGWHLGDYHQLDGKGWQDYNPESATWHHYYHTHMGWPYDTIKLEDLGDGFKRITLNSQLSNTRTDGRHAPAQFGATDSILATFSGDRFTSQRSETRHYVRLLQTGDSTFVNIDKERSTSSALDDGIPVWQLYGVSFWHEADNVRLVVPTKEDPVGTDTVKFFFREPVGTKTPRYAYYPVELRNTGDAAESYRVLMKLAPRGYPTFDPATMETLKLFADTNSNGKVDAGEATLGAVTPVVPAKSVRRYIARIDLSLLASKDARGKPEPLEFHVTLNAIEPNKDVSLRGTTLRFIAYKTNFPERKTVENLRVGSVIDTDLPPNRAPVATIRASVNGVTVSSGATVTAGQEIVLESVGVDPDANVNSAKEMGHKFYRPDGLSTPGATLRYKTWREGQNAFLLHVSDGYSRAFEDFSVNVVANPAKQAPVARIQYPESKELKGPDKKTKIVQEPTYPAGHPIFFSAPVGFKWNHDPDGGAANTKRGITRFEWDFGDGTVVKDDQFPEHSYIKDGTYKVTLTVTDDESATSSDTQVVRVSTPNRPPVPRIESVSPESFMRFGAVEVTAAGSVDPDGDKEIASYEWSFEGPNRYNVHEAFVLPAGPRYLFPAWFAGDYTVRVTITDIWGAKASASQKVTVKPWDGLYRVNAIASQGGPGAIYKGFDIDSGIVKGWTLLHGGLVGSKIAVMGATAKQEPVTLAAPTSHEPIRNDTLPAGTPDSLKGVFSSAVGALYGGTLAQIANLPAGEYQVTAYLYDSRNAAPGQSYVVRFGKTALALTVPEKPTYKDFVVSGVVKHTPVGKSNRLDIIGDADSKTPYSSPLAGFTLKRIK